MLFFFRSAEFKTDPLTKNSFNIHSFDDLDFISSTQVSRCSCCKHYCRTAAHQCAVLLWSPDVGLTHGEFGSSASRSLIVTFEPHDVSERSD